MPEDRRPLAAPRSTSRVCTDRVSTAAEHLCAERVGERSDSERRIRRRGRRQHDLELALLAGQAIAAVSYPSATIASTTPSRTRSTSGPGTSRATLDTEPTTAQRRSEPFRARSCAVISPAYLPREEDGEDADDRQHQERQRLEGRGGHHRVAREREAEACDLRPWWEHDREEDERDGVGEGEGGVRRVGGTPHDRDQHDVEGRPCEEDPTAGRGPVQPLPGEERDDRSDGDQPQEHGQERPEAGRVPAEDRHRRSRAQRREERRAEADAERARPQRLRDVPSPGRPTPPT